MIGLNFNFTNDEADAEGAAAILTQLEYKRDRHSQE